MSNASLDELEQGIPTPKELIADPCTPTKLAEFITWLDKCDVVDASSYTHVLALAFKAKCDKVLYNK